MRSKEQNKNAPSSPGFHLPKSHILRGRTNFKSLFSNSKFLSTPSITLRYSLSSHPTGEIQMAFISPKKIGTAVERNRTRRLLREAYRLNNKLLVPSGGDFPAVSMHGALIARKSLPTFEAVQQEITTLLSDLRNRVAAYSNT